MTIPQQITHATLKTFPAIAPGAVTIAADWLDVINTGLSAALMILSILFLLWRWRVAWMKQRKG